MTTANLTPCYRAHLVRIDGQPFDTPTGTLTYSHAYRRRNGKPYSAAYVARYFEKRHSWRGLRVERVETYFFDANA